MAKDTHYNNYYLEPGQHQVPRIQNSSSVCPQKLRIWRCFWPHIPWILRHQCSSCSSFTLLRGLLFLCLAFECWLYPFPFTLYFLSGKSHPVQLLQFPHMCVILTCVLLSYISSELQNNSSQGSSVTWICLQQSSSQICFSSTVFILCEWNYFTQLSKQECGIVLDS